MGFFTLLVLETLVTSTDRKHPVRAHLNAFVHRLKGFVVECVFAGFLLRRPDQSLVGVGQALAAEVWHRVRLTPNNIVENPKALVLQLSTHAEYVMVGTDDPDCAIRLKQALCSSEPCFGKTVVNGETIELVPRIVNSVDLGIVRAMQITLKLKVIRWVSKDQINTALGQAVHDVNTIAIDDRVQG